MVRYLLFYFIISRFLVRYLVSLVSFELYPVHLSEYVWYCIDWDVPFLENDKILELKFHVKNIHHHGNEYVKKKEEHVKLSCAKLSEVVFAKSYFLSCLCC